MLLWADALVPQQAAELRVCSLWPRSDDQEVASMLAACPAAYYSVSAPKAELLNKIKDMPEEVTEAEEQVDVNEKKVSDGARGRQRLLRVGGAGARPVPDPARPVLGA